MESFWRILASGYPMERTAKLVLKSQTMYFLPLAGFFWVWTGFVPIPLVPPVLTDSISVPGSLSFSSNSVPSLLKFLSLLLLGAQPEPSLKESPEKHLTSIVLMSSTTVESLTWGSSLWVPMEALPAYLCWTAGHSQVPSMMSVKFHYPSKAKSTRKTENISQYP